MIEGGSYALHGATLNGPRLTAPVPVTAAFDDWCALQTPVSWDGECFYAVDSPATFTLSQDNCLQDEQPVDCSWLLLAQAHVCSCTDATCFASTAPDAEGLDLRANEDGTELTGSLLSNTVHLTRE